MFCFQIPKTTRTQGISAALFVSTRRRKLIAATGGGKI